MNKVTRMLTMTGIAVGVGLTMGVGPASAAPAAPAGTGHATQVQAKAPKFKTKERVVGYYRSARDCNRVGKMGEFRKKWDDFDCDRVQRGPKRGWIALKAQWEVRGHGHGPWGQPQGPKGHGHGPQGPRGHR
ncbi:hypothetical protein JIG36_08150 [Actinoplanes sp. LDG1-06]|uniref:Uncharacterized protein n=1 Tax=Paractinoplanes ovalisporus TaxID=2810368 RepID=A0ABS2A6T1_9ACTN|nr:hypothetical protein [Actinoplanes ovalisporus]MBM2615536.1 hypothetical protein [Actinoplanes ovalisporus]